MNRFAYPICIIGLLYLTFLNSNRAAESFYHNPASPSKSAAASNKLRVDIEQTVKANERLSPIDASNKMDLTIANYLHRGMKFAEAEKILIDAGFRITSSSEIAPNGAKREFRFAVLEDVNRQDSFLRLIHRVGIRLDPEPASTFDKLGQFSSTVYSLMP